MPDKEVYSKASDVVANEGTVNVDGPDGVDVSLTPEAAEETGDRLIQEAANASGQRWFRRLADKDKKQHD